MESNFIKLYLFRSQNTVGCSISVGIHDKTDRFQQWLVLPHLENLATLTLKPCDKDSNLNKYYTLLKEKIKFSKKLNIN